MPAPHRKIVSFYWNNVDSRLVRSQADVFRHFGYAIEQHLRDGVQHGAFMDALLNDAKDDDIFLFVDIDCIPLRRDVIERAFQFAESGGILGCAQSTNRADFKKIFTAPSFLALSQRTWNKLGRPSFAPVGTIDVAERFHDIAHDNQIAIEYLFPWACVIPKWNLANKRLFGIGTFYEGGVFHLYQSRSSVYAALFLTVADDAMNDRDSDVIGLCHRMMLRYPFVSAWGYVRRRSIGLARSLSWARWKRRLNRLHS